MPLWGLMLAKATIMPESARAASAISSLEMRLRPSSASQSAVNITRPSFRSQ